MSSTEELIVRVLAEHEFMPCAEHTPTVNVWWAQCEGCDWRGPRRSQRHSHANDHRAHVAVAIADAVREWLTGQRDQIAEAITAPSHARIRANGYVPMTTADDWLAEADAVLVALTAKEIA